MSKYPKFVQFVKDCLMFALLMSMLVYASISPKYANAATMINGMQMVSLNKTYFPLIEPYGKSEDGSYDLYEVTTDSVSLDFVYKRYWYNAVEIAIALPAIEKADKHRFKCVVLCYDSKNRVVGLNPAYKRRN